MISSLSTFKKILIVPGQQKPDAAIQNILGKMMRNGIAVVVADTISNMQSDDTINYHDHFVGIENLNQPLNPDMVLTFGKSIISKNLKIFLTGLNLHLMIELLETKAILKEKLIFQ